MMQDTVDAVVVPITEQTDARLILFDLDNCLFDTRKMGAQLLDPVLSVLRVSDLSDEQKAGIVEAMWTMSFSAVVSRFAVPNDLAVAMRSVYASLVAPEGPDYSYGDQKRLVEFDQHMILVTSGFRRLQRSKIARLGDLGYYFDEVIIDSEDDPDSRLGKLEIFKHAQLRLGIRSPSQILVVGDSGSSELAAGKELGFVTVQTLRPGVERWDDAEFHITSLSEL